MCIFENHQIEQRISNLHSVEYDMLDGILLLREFDDFPEDTEQPTDIEAQEIALDFIYVNGPFIFNDGIKLTANGNILLQKDWRDRLRQLITKLKMN